SPALTLKLSESTATTPPKRLVRFFTSSRNTPWSPSKEPGDPSKPSRQSIGHKQDDQNKQRAVDQQIRLSEFIPENLGRQLEQQRSQDRARNRAQPSDNCHQHDLNRQRQRKHDRGIDEQKVIGVKRSGDGSQTRA